MNLLGAVLAGGRARRFGSDKALALVKGETMIAHVIAALRPQVDRVAVCGRDWPGTIALTDLWSGGIGPLAGLHAALTYAHIQGFRAVLSVPVDCPWLPNNMVTLLDGEGPASFTPQHSIGLWPAPCLAILNAYLAGGGRSMHGWNALCKARAVNEPFAIPNINTLADLIQTISMEGVEETIRAIVI